MGLDSKRFDDVTDTRTGKKVPSFNTKTQMGPRDMPNMAIEKIVRRMEPQLGKAPQKGSASLSRTSVPDTPPSGRRPTGSSLHKSIPAGKSYSAAAKRKLGM